jgi:hypothetical protein
VEKAEPMLEASMRGTRCADGAGSGVLDARVARAKKSAMGRCIMVDGMGFLMVGKEFVMEK